MTRLEALKALHEKLLEGAVESKRDFRCIAPEDLRLEGEAYGFWIDAWCNAERAYSGSLDAAKALHDALLPGWVVRLTATNGKDRSSPYVHIFRMRDSEADAPLDVNSSGYKGQSPARAWLLAILNALIAQEADQ